jgi:hypothetical protein
VHKEIKLTSNDYKFVLEKGAYSPKMMRLGTFLLLQSTIIIAIQRIFLLWTSFGEEEKTWANITRLVGLFDIEWKTPHQNNIVKF